MMDMVQENNCFCFANKHYIEKELRELVTSLPSYIKDTTDITTQTSLPSYIKDTTDFLNKVTQIAQPLPNDTILFCFDVVALYQSVPRTE